MAKLERSEIRRVQDWQRHRDSSFRLRRQRITGKGIWGPPEDRPETLRILKRVPELGIVHRHRRLYGPDVSRELIRDALYNYDGPSAKTLANPRIPC